MEKHNRIEIIVLEFSFTDFEYHSLLKEDVILNVFAGTMRNSNPTVIDLTISTTSNLNPCCSIKTRTIVAIRDYYEDFTQDMILGLIEYAGQNSLQAYRLFLKKHCGFVPEMKDPELKDILPNLSINESSVDPLVN